MRHQPGTDWKHEKWVEGDARCALLKNLPLSNRTISRLTEPQSWESLRAPEDMPQTAGDLEYISVRELSKIWGMGRISLTEISTWMEAQNLAIGSRDPDVMMVRVDQEELKELRALARGELPLSLSQLEEEELRNLRHQVLILRSELNKWQTVRGPASLTFMQDQYRSALLPKPAAPAVAYINALEHHLAHANRGVALAREKFDALVRSQTPGKGCLLSCACQKDIDDDCDCGYSAAEDVRTFCEEALEELLSEYLLDEDSEGHWFWVEKEVARYGPFPSREEALAASQLYSQELRGTP